MFKVNNKNEEAIVNKATSTTSFWCCYFQLQTCFTLFSSVSIAKMLVFITISTNLSPINIFWNASKVFLLYHLVLLVTQLNQKQCHIFNFTLSHFQCHLFSTFLYFSCMSLLFFIRGSDNTQKQSSRGVVRKRSSGNMQQNYRRTPMPKCDFNKIALQRKVSLLKSHFSMGFLL